MFRFSFKCPHCGERNQHSLWSFQSRHVCESCQTQIHVEPKMLFNVLSTVLLLIFSEVQFHALEMMQLPSVLMWGLLIILIFVEYYAIKWVFITVFGLKKLYYIIED